MKPRRSRDQITREVDGILERCCSKCGGWLKQSAENFRRYGDEWRPECIPCDRAYHLRRYHGQSDPEPVEALPPPPALAALLGYPTTPPVHAPTRVVRRA